MALSADFFPMGQFIRVMYEDFHNLRFLFEHLNSLTNSGGFRVRQNKLHGLILVHNTLIKTLLLMNAYGSINAIAIICRSNLFYLTLDPPMLANVINNLWQWISTGRKIVR